MQPHYLGCSLFLPPSKRCESMSPISSHVIHEADLNNASNTFVLENYIDDGSFLANRVVVVIEGKLMYAY